jgi:hypothetical protein
MDGGLSDNNPSLLAYLEMHSVMPEHGRLDQFVSVGTGACKLRQMCSTKTWLSRVSGMSSVPHTFEHYWDHNFDGNREFSKFRHTLTVTLPDGDSDVDSWLRRYNLSLGAKLPDLADAQAMDGLADAAMAYFTADPALEDLALAILASTFYFELRRMPVYENGSYTCYGRILSRVPVTHPAFTALMQKLESTHAEFEVQERAVRNRKLTRGHMGNFCKPVCIYVEELKQLAAVRLRFSGKNAYHISASPFSIESLIKLQKLEWAGVRNAAPVRSGTAQKRPSSDCQSQIAKRRFHTQ